MARAPLGWGRSARFKSAAGPIETFSFWRVPRHYGFGAPARDVVAGNPAGPIQPFSEDQMNNRVLFFYISMSSGHQRAAEAVHGSA